MCLHWQRPDTLQVRVPSRCPDHLIDQFINKNEAWINAQWQRSQRWPGLPDSRYEQGGRLWLLGEPYEIRVLASDGSTELQLTEEQLIVTSRKLDRGYVERQILAWKRQFAELYFSQRLVEIHQGSAVPLPDYDFVVRNMKRQWGNCSRDGLIKLNVSLLRYPPACIDYVISHELTHLVHFNHGVRFYQLLEQLCPTWAEDKQLLECYSG